MTNEFGVKKMGSNCEIGVRKDYTNEASTTPMMIYYIFPHNQWQKE